MRIQTRGKVNTVIKAALVLEIFAGMKHCVSAYFNDMQSDLIIRITIINKSGFSYFYQPAIIAKLTKFSNTTVIGFLA